MLRRPRGCGAEEMGFLEGKGEHANQTGSSRTFVRGAVRARLNDPGLITPSTMPHVPLPVGLTPPHLLRWLFLAQAAEIRQLYRGALIQISRGPCQWRVNWGGGDHEPPQGSDAG